VTSPGPVTVRILEKEYQVACPPGERNALLDSAEFLNARMREIRDTGKVVGLDRIAVMAALENDARQRLRGMRERVEGALQNGRQLEL
jgi:cell division protein ZapA